MMHSIMNTIPFGVYQRCVQSTLRDLSGVAITAEWWDSQRRPDGQHRSWGHYTMNLSPEMSAQELLPFAIAQLKNPLPQTDHWRDVCSSWTKDTEI